MADPNGLYSYRGEEPTFITEIMLSSGLRRTNPETFTDEELADAGYTGPYTKPSFDPGIETQHWDSNLRAWVNTPIPDEELWARVRSMRNQLLAETDWMMAADAPETINFVEWGLYRQRLRDITTLYQDPRDVVWPITPEGRSDDEFDRPRVFENRLRDRIFELEGKVQVLIEKLLSQETNS